MRKSEMKDIINDQKEAIYILIDKNDKLIDQVSYLNGLVKRQAELIAALRLERDSLKRCLKMPVEIDFPNTGD